MKKVNRITIISNPWICFKNKYKTGTNQPGTYFIALIPSFLAVISIGADIFTFIDISNVPKFRWQPDKLLDSIQKSIGKLGVMTLIAILLFYMSFVSFSRYDVR